MAVIEQFQWVQTQAEQETLETQTQPLLLQIQWIWEWEKEVSVVRKWIGKRGCKIEKEDEMRMVAKLRNEILLRFVKLNNGLRKKNRE
jgi:hypothetical protein